METSKHVYIRGNAEHPEKVMEALEKHGCKNPCDVVPLHRDYLYFIDMDGNLDYAAHSNMLYHLLIEFGEELFIEPDYKFKVGDKVTSPMNHCKECGEITQLINRKGEPWHRLKYIGIVPESELEPYTKSQISDNATISAREEQIKFASYDVDNYRFTDELHEDYYHFQDGAKWADKTVLSMVQEYVTCHRMTIAEGKSESFVDGYNNALVHLRDFLFYRLTVAKSE